MVTCGHDFEESGCLFIQYSQSIINKIKLTAVCVLGKGKCTYILKNSQKLQKELSENMYSFDKKIRKLTIAVRLL